AYTEAGATVLRDLFTEDRGGYVVELGRAGGLSAIPCNLIVWAVPGAMIGAVAGAHFALGGSTPSPRSRRSKSGSFAKINLPSSSDCVRSRLHASISTGYDLGRTEVPQGHLLGRFALRRRR
ncbi:hypothetical protein KXV85_011391, partial [Aspergillus fumigatus]